MKIVINPRGNILYKSFYIKSIEDYVGSRNVSYSDMPFATLSLDIRNSKNVLFVVYDSSKIEKKIYISTDDFYQINDEAYEWCDIYGHVNANFALTESKYLPKLISLCPSFGVQCWNLGKTIIHAILDYRIGMGSLRKHFGKYKRLLINRRQLEEYYKMLYVNNKQKPYVFFCSTLWFNNEKNNNDLNVNLSRANFIRACKDISTLHFEGGLVAQSDNRSSIEKFADCLYKGVDIDKWIEKTKQSYVVFNTPAFWKCHGWKLGEYLAMGKCIISTPLSNDLPFPLEHGVNIHFVQNDKKAIQAAIEYIISHPEYKSHLEKGAREYWYKYGSPTASLKLLGI